ncbi:TIGR03758 family integrating conjugative element protein [Erwinia psidii]|uniref:TIGR03758 family integrating conjugative element protein n=1 Tax=Erwinia psidii TaxID=69224 RepID=UPI00226B55F0|nr:TIGR03758 family integrating conjugative element protein [Erwinia psidii]MCX8967301.1 TIGR03758 family integrating conjugative element protein [Erwinia psidii]
MTAEQLAAFQAGSSAKAAEVNLLFLGLLCAVLLLWSAWVCLSSYRAFAAGNLSLKQLGSIVARLVLLVLITFWLVLS